MARRGAGLGSRLPVRVAAGASALTAVALLSCSAPPKPSRPPAPSTQHSVALLKQPTPPAEVDAPAIDPQVSPCDDLYQHACGGWLASAVVPSARQWIDLSGEQISKRRRELSYALLAGPSSAADEQLIQAPRRLFRACMAEEAVERVGLEGVEELLQQLDGVSDKKLLAASVALLHQSGVQALFQLRPELEQAGAVAGVRWSWRLSPAGRGLTSSSPAGQRRYAKLVADTLARLQPSSSQRAGSAADQQRMARHVAHLERELADAAARSAGQQVSASALDPSPSEQGPLGPGFDWPAYLRARGLDATLAASTRAPEWLKALSSALATTPLSVVKAQLKWRVARSLTLALPRGIRDPISAALPAPGETTSKPRRDACIGAVEQLFSSELSHAFAERALDARERLRAAQLAGAVSASFGRLLEGPSSLSAAERTELRQRLDSTQFQLGAGRLETPLLLPKSGSFAALLLFAERAQTAREVRRAASAPDRQHMPVPASTPNMFYHPLLRAVVAPAGYLLPPNFDATKGPASNYARVGFGFAHELAHAFDADWLKRQASCLEQDLSASAPRTGLPIPHGSAQVSASGPAGPAGAGEPAGAAYSAQALARLRPEALADSAGIRVAYQAFVAALIDAPPPPAERAAGAQTPNQVFWLNYAQSQCRKVTPEGEAWLQRNDPHLSSHARVNLTARSVPEFAADFGCSAERPMAQTSSCAW